MGYQNPGEEGEFKVVFDTTGKVGKQTRIIWVRHLGEKQELKLYGEVE